MSCETFKYIICFALILGFLFFILKSLVKATVIGVIIVVLFKIGWVYTSDDLKNKLFLDKTINDKYIESIYNKYDGYVNKRNNKDNIIDIDKTKGNILEELDKKVNKYKENLN